MESDESIWKILEEREGEVNQDLNIWSSIKEKLDVSKKKPEKINEVEIKKFERKGKPYYVLKNLENNKFLQLSEEDFFVWESLNGETSIRDIALAYFLKYNSMGFANIGTLIGKLISNGFLKEKSVNTLGILQHHFAKKTMKYKVMMSLRKIINFSYQIHDVDSKMKSLYKKFAWIFYTKPFIIISVLLTLMGIILFYKILMIDPDSFSNLSPGELLAAFLLLNGCLVIHELAHGFTTTHYGREVGGFGLMLYYGGVAAFCETTDIWMAPRFSRFAVSFVGPYTNFFLASILSIISFFSLGNSTCVSILLKAAFLNYLLGLLNLNPLLEWDGYYMIMDYLEIPNMRKKSFAFLKREFFNKIKNSKKFSREEKILASYGIIAFAYTAFIVLFIPFRFYGVIKPVLE
jgi:putative peptide zinc metalloprotease protein